MYLILHFHNNGIKLFLKGARDCLLSWFSLFQEPTSLLLKICSLTVLRTVLSTSSYSELSLPPSKNCSVYVVMTSWECLCSCLVIRLSTSVRRLRACHSHSFQVLYHHPRHILVDTFLECWGQRTRLVAGLCLCFQAVGCRLDRHGPYLAWANRPITYNVLTSDVLM